VDPPEILQRDGNQIVDDHQLGCPETGKTLLPCCDQPLIFGQLLESPSHRFQKHINSSLYDLLFGKRTTLKKIPDGPQPPLERPTKLALDYAVNGQEEHQLSEENSVAPRLRVVVDVSEDAVDDERREQSEEEDPLPLAASPTVAHTDEMPEKHELPPLFVRCRNDIRPGASVRERADRHYSPATALP